MAPLQPLYERYCGLIHRAADNIRLTEHTVITQLLAETLACIILVFFVDGSAAQTVLGPSALSQMLNIPLGCGGAVAVCIIVAGKACPALVNPALALAHTIIGRLRWSLLPAYVLLEFFGAYLGAGLVLAVYRSKILDYAAHNDSGSFLMNSTGSIFVTSSSLSLGATVLAQVITTGFLAFGIYTMIEGRLPIVPAGISPALLGMVVFLALSAYTGAGGAPLNPARDFGPRLMCLSTYWGLAAFQADDYYFWVALVAPTIGMVIGAILYEVLIGVHTENVETVSLDDDDSQADYAVDSPIVKVL